MRRNKVVAASKKMRMAINAMRHFFVKGFLRFLAVRNLGRDTNLVVGRNGEAEDGAANEVGRGVNGGYGVENALDGARLSMGFLPSAEVSGGVAGTSCLVLSDIEDCGEDWARGNLMVLASCSV